MREHAKVFMVGMWVGFMFGVVTGMWVVDHQVSAEIDGWQPNRSSAFPYANDEQQRFQDYQLRQQELQWLQRQNSRPPC